MPSRKRAKPQRPAGAASFYLDAVGSSFGRSPISLEALVDATPDAILFIDGERKIRFWSRGAAEMFGYSREEATGAYYDLLLPPDLKEARELEALERATIERGFVRHHLTRRIGKDGSEKIVSLSRTALRDARSAVVGWLVILRDMTEQARVEQELSRARGLAMLGELAATVAHEIKNPLAGIYGATQILVAETPASDARREVLERMADQMRRLDATVRDLLRFARPETPRVERVDLRELAASLATALREDAGFASVEIRLAGAKELAADCDPRLVEQALRNLLENARDAMDGKGRITLTFAREGDDAVMRVADSGPGIPDAVFARIFDPFFTTKPRGTGLGLAICRKNVEAHGGTITARNGIAGAEFVVRLPPVRSSPAFPSR